MEVKIWQEQIILPTYEAGKPDKNPMFFENRIYQGSSGVVYPHPVIESIADEKTDKAYIGLFLENEYIKIMILPELGGRVQMAFDKIANRHFIYYNQVIKPALVGLCGPWISGGIEFNWPQHHRPSTFEPVDYKIDENADGSKTVWVNEVEKMFRTKGMAGFTLHPGKAYLEIKAQLYNRTTLPQTFLWWANPAVSVGEHYQSVFPPDVNAVFDHGKRDVSTFPIATGTYYKVDYSPGTDISRYKNIPVPTSYMAVNSNFDFVGGYEHDTQAGVLHVSDHHVSPGKKQWTWGNGDFGVAWDRNLTDEDGPYIELMTGMFTDNQPDFSWLMPYEEKSFTQYFLPYRELGLVKNATKDILIGLEQTGTEATLKIFVTSKADDIKISFSQDKEQLLEEVTSLSPDIVYTKSIQTKHIPDGSLHVIITNRNGKELISYHSDFETRKIPEAAKPALLPHEIENTEQLFLTGQHLEQYRHATYSPIPYYEEALKRDAGDYRSNNAIGLWLLRKGQFEKSISYFKQAIQTATQRNPNPYDSEAYYNLGLALHYLGRNQESYQSFFKATWSSTWQDAAYFGVAQIDIRNQDYEKALEHINWSIDKNARNSKAYLIKIYALRKLNRLDEALETVAFALKRDAFNLSVIFEAHYCYVAQGQPQKAEECLTRLKKLSRGTTHNLIEYAIDYADLGLYDNAQNLLALLADDYQRDPMLNYYNAYFSFCAGNSNGKELLEIAASANPDYCFPNRLEDIIVLQFTIEHNPSDARALYYLGNLWYDKRQYDDAISAWVRSAELDKTFPTTYRNLAIAAYNKLKDKALALQFFEKAYSLNESDARVLMELDQLYKKLNYTAKHRLGLLENHRAIVDQRDDLYLELAALNNYLGNYEKGYEMIMSRKFHPWEGGEGKVSGQYIYSLVELAKADIQNQQYNSAIKKLEQAQVYPDNLGEGKLPGAQENDIFYWLGCCYEYLGMQDKATHYWQMATRGLSEPTAAMFYNDQQPDQIFYQGLAWGKLAKREIADQIFNNLINYGMAHQNDKIKIDYFAVSLPDLLIFEDNLDLRNYIHCQYLMGLGYLGIKQNEKAQIAFDNVFENDKMHFGVNLHIQMTIRS